jgi:hypothetical protein
MKLRGISFKVTSFDDDNFETAYTYVIEGLPPVYSIAKVFTSAYGAHTDAQATIYALIRRGA